MSRDRKGPRKVGLTSPKILVPAIVALVILTVVLWLAGMRGEASSSAVPEPAGKKTYAQFEDELREFELNDASIRMYRDKLYVYPSGRDPYVVQDVSPEYTIGLLRKFMKTPNQSINLDGIPQESGQPGPMAWGLLVVVAVLPYLFLGWLTVMLVRGAAGAAEVDPESGEESRCPECSKPVPRDSRFCLHCAHPINWAGGGRQCPGCGQQTWKNDRFCRSCGKNLPPPEPRRSVEAGAPAAGPRPPAARPGAPEAGAAPPAGPAPPARATAEIPTSGLAAAPAVAPKEAERGGPSEPVRPPARPAAGRPTAETGRPAAERPSEPGRPAAGRASDPGRPAARPADPGRPAAGRAPEPARPAARPAEPGRPAARPESPPAPERLRPNRPPTPGPLPGEKP